MSKTRLRQAVLRDSAWLFNATRLEIEQRPGAARRTCAARSSTSACPRCPASGAVARRRRARARDPPGDRRLRAAHPAGDAAGQGARRRRAPLDHHNVIGFEIRGELWAQPVPLELLVRTEIDLETGKVEIADLALSRGGRDGPASPPALQPRAAAPARDGRGVRAAVSQDRRAARHERPRGRRSRTSSGCSKASASWPRACSSSWRPSSRASPRRCSRSSTRTTSRRRRRCWSRSSRRTRTTRAWRRGSSRSPRGTTHARACSPADDVTACEFRTAHDVTLWPIEIVSASYFSFAPDLPLNTLAGCARASKAACASGSRRPRG